jgi:fructose-1,6-bisphosphatase
MIGYGIEDGSSELEFGVDSGFVLKISRELSMRISAFYSQTGRDLNSQNYYLYGVRGFLTLEF